MSSSLFAANIASVTIALVFLFVVALMLHLHERWTGRFIAHRLGWRGVLLTAWIGVPLHELSHLLLALLFRHRIIAWKLFDPDPVSGTLGYVRHGPSRATLYQRAGNFFIGIGPLIGGGTALVMLLWWATPRFEWGAELRRLVLAPSSLAALATAALPTAQNLLHLGQRVVTAAWRSRTAALPLQLYLCACVSCHMAPSRADLHAALAGALFTGSLLVLASLAAAIWNTSLAGCLAALPLLTLLLSLSSTFQVLYVSFVSVCCRSARRGLLTARSQTRS